MTLVILSISPLLFGVALIFTKIVAYITTNELKSYAKAGRNIFSSEHIFKGLR